MCQAKEALRQERKEGAGNNTEQNSIGEGTSGEENNKQEGAITGEITSGDAKMAAPITEGEVANTAVPMIKAAPADIQGLCELAKKGGDGEAPQAATERVSELLGTPEKPAKCTVRLGGKVAPEAAAKWDEVVALASKRGGFRRPSEQAAKRKKDSEEIAISMLFPWAEAIREQQRMEMKKKNSKLAALNKLPRTLLAKALGKGTYTNLSKNDGGQLGRGDKKAAFRKEEEEEGLLQIREASGLRAA